MTRRIAQPTSNIQHPTSNIQHPTSNNDYCRFKFGLVVLPLSIATALAGFPGSAFAQVSAQKTTHALLNNHPSYQSVTVLTGDTQTVHSTLRKRDPLPGVGDPVPPPTNTQPAKVKLQAIDLNTHTHQATIILSNGFKAVLDGQRQTITMAYAGQIVTVPLDKALLKWANGNTALANKRKQKLLKMLNIKINNARLATIDSASPDTYFSPSTQSGVVPNSTYVHTNVMYVPPVTVIATPLPRFSCWATFSCFYDPIPRQSWQPDNIHYGFWFQGGGGSSQPKHKNETNYEAWEAYRLEHCDAATDHEIASGVGVASSYAGAVALALISNPVGWIVAAVGLAGAAIEATYHFHEYIENERICKSTYPGVGNWP